MYFEKILDSPNMKFNKYSYANRRKSILMKNTERVFVSIPAFVLANFRTKLQKAWLLTSVFCVCICVFTCVCVLLFSS